MNGREFQEALRIVYCMGPNQYIEVWGKDIGEHLWDKFVNVYERNPFDLIVNLDQNTITKLMVYLYDKLALINLSDKGE